MKKLILMLLVLVGGVVQMQADWYVRGSFNGWDASDDWKLSSTDEINYTLVKENFEVASETTYEFKVDNGSWNESYPGSNYAVKIPAGTYDLFFYFNASTHDVKVIYNVELRSTDGLLGTFTRTGAGTYSLTLDLSKSLADQYFKPVTYYSTSADWMGVGSFNSGAQLTDTESLLDTSTDVGDGKGYYYILKNSNKTYKTYTFTVTYNADGWNMSVAGADAREHTSYTVSFVDGNSWGDDNVYAYTYSPEQSGPWPGKKMTREGNVTIAGKDYPKYTYTFEAYEPYSTNIIFNNGKEAEELAQTGNLTLTNGHQYMHGVDVAPVYAVVGSSATLFGANWDAANTTSYMAGPVNGIYTFTAENVELDAQTITLKVIQKAYTETETVDAWYPSKDVSLAIPVAGKYNVTITFNSGAVNLYDQSSVVATAEKISEKIEIGSAGWATTVTNSPLNFSESGVTAYTATVADSKVTLTAVTNVQAGTGLVLEGAEGTYYIPVIESSETDKGSLMYSSTDTYQTWSNEGNDNYFYGLALDKETNKVRFALIDRSEGEVTIPARKAFLMITNPTTPARELDVEFSNGTTGISEVKGAKVAAEGCYNLAGQRVAQPAKGLYIVGGKKVIVK